MIEGDGDEAGLGLDEAERLPWLESADEAHDDRRDAPPGRVMAIVAGSLLLIAAVIGLIAYLQHRATTRATEGNGQLIAAQEGDYKVKPEDAGGKHFDGEGQTAFAASEGKPTPAGIVASTGSGDKAKPATATDGKATAATPAGAGDIPAGAGMVQLGAFSDTAKAEAAWQRMSGHIPPLSGLTRHIGTGTVEGRTVYRLAAITKDGGAAKTLCDTLRQQDVSCLVVR